MRKTNDHAPRKGTKDKKVMGVIDRLIAAFGAKDQKSFDEAVEGLKKEVGEEDAAPEAATMESTAGPSIHIHLPGESQAKGNPDGTADEEPSNAEDPTEKRFKALEDGQSAIMGMLKKLVGEEGEEAEEMEGDEQQGEEEAEGEAPASAEDAEAGEEEAEGKVPKSAKDKKTVFKDSAHLKDEFREVVADAEIIAPGLKMPTFDAKAKPKTTADGLCLLRRRALAAARRSEDSAEVIKTVLGKATLDGMACDQLGIVFNSAVALMKDRNSVTAGSGKNARPAKDNKPVITSPASFNDAMRAHFKQPSLRPGQN